MKMKRCLSLILCAVMALTVAVSDPVFAEKTDQKEIVYADNAEYTESLEDLLEELPGNDELFEGYVNELFYGSYGVSTFGDYAKDKLTGNDAVAYRILKENIQKIASGETSSTKIMIPFTELGVPAEGCTAAELGVASIIENGKISEAALNALKKKISINMSNVLNYLLVDCPYDLYWFDKTTGLTSSGYSMSATSERITIQEEGIIWYFAVAKNYQSETAEEQEKLYTVKSSLAQTAITASENAKAIVEKYEEYSDYRKLDAYREEICSLVNYNHDAADHDDTPYGDPWQLVWVFDGDENTDVVCEGYSKAFQYLCDMSEFVSRGIQCYTVTGTMGGGTGAGGHMWNIVTMDDGKNYLVDITNCDEGSIGADKKLFLVGAKRGTQNGETSYTVTIAGQNVIYCYDDNSKIIYGDILNIEASDYEVKDIDGGHFEGVSIGWTLDGTGCLTITGTGEMPKIQADSVEAIYKAIPWLKHQINISKVVVSEGITGISSYAFAYTQSLKEVSLPSTLERIGQDTFSDSAIEVLELPEGLTEIVAWAFRDCKNLKEITIPASVKFVGSEAFAGCSSLSDVRFLGKCPLFIENTYEDETGAIKKMGSAFAGDTLTIHYPKEEEETETNYNVGGEIVSCIWKSIRESEKFADATVSWIAYCKEHAWDTDKTVDKDATCSEKGSKSIHCQNCGEIKDSEEIPTIAHTYGAWTVVQESTCSEPGSRKQICSVCQEENIEAIDRIPHTWNDEFTIDLESTCIAPGNQSKHCIVCGEKDLETMAEVPLAAHTLTKMTSPNGDYYLCSVCSKTFSDAEGTKEITVNNKILVDRISISAISTKIAAGKKVALQAEVLPADASDKKVTWESSNPSYATVNPATGVVSTKKAGVGKSVTITAKAADGSGKSASITLQLMKDAVKKVKIQNAQKRLKAGRSMRLKAKITGTGKKLNKTVKWTSSNEKYATVTSKGVVKAMSAGKGKTVKITAMATDGSNKKATVKIKIN